MVRALEDVWRSILKIKFFEVSLSLLFFPLIHLPGIEILANVSLPARGLRSTILLNHWLWSGLRITMASWVLTRSSDAFFGACSLQSRTLPPSAGSGTFPHPREGVFSASLYNKLKPSSYARIVSSECLLMFYPAHANARPKVSAGGFFDRQKIITHWPTDSNWRRERKLLDE